MSYTDEYPPPLAQLFDLGSEKGDTPAKVDYLALGFGPEHVPALIGLVSDRRLDFAGQPATWATVHAWRALGQLRAAEAVEPLLALLDSVVGDDYVLGDLPRALGEIGAPALPTLTRYLADRERPEWSRVAITEAFAHAGKVHPDLRSTCVDALTNQLREYRNQDDDLNAFLITGLLDLHAVESAPLIEEAFAADCVDISINGDWEDVQVELGLLPARITPRPRYHAEFLPRALAEQPARAAPPKRAKRAAEKRRRKLAKQSKRRNRRRK